MSRSTIYNGCILQGENKMFARHMLKSSETHRPEVTLTILTVKVLTYINFFPILILPSKIFT